MSEPQRDPQQEYDTLHRPLDRFQEQWAEHRTIDAFFTFSDAIDRATEAVTLFERQKTGRDKKFRFQLVRLTILLTGARLARQSAYEDTLVSIEQRMGDEAPLGEGGEASFPAGTIVSCPACGARSPKSC